MPFLTFVVYCIGFILLCHGVYENFTMGLEAQDYQWCILNVFMGFFLWKTFWTHHLHLKSYHAMNAGRAWLDDQWRKLDQERKILEVERALLEKLKKSQ